MKYRYTFFFLCLFCTLPFFSQSSFNYDSFMENFSDFELVKIGPTGKNEYDTYIIGENWQQVTAKRYIKSFRINKFETTYNLWFSVLSQAEKNGYIFMNPGQEGSNGARGRTPSENGKYQPVTDITWYDAVVWCNALSEQRGRTPCYTYEGEVIRDASDTAILDLAECNWEADGYRLPTEAEWEYAARWTYTGFQRGDLASGLKDKTNPLQKSVTTGDVAWYDTDGTHIVGTAGNIFDERMSIAPGTGRKNGAGLFDMSGNVLEYCWDWYEEYNEVKEGEFATGPEYGFERVSRGGCWNPYPGLIITAARFKYDPNETYNYLGFRFCSSK